MSRELKARFNCSGSFTACCCFPRLTAALATNVGRQILILLEVAAAFELCPNSSRLAETFGSEISEVAGGIGILLTLRACSFLLSTGALLAVTSYCFEVSSVCFHRARFGRLSAAVTFAVSSFRSEFALATPLTLRISSTAHLFESVLTRTRNSLPVAGRDAFSSPPVS